MISTTTSKIQYSPDGATVIFAIPFVFLDNSHVKVVKTVAGVSITQVIDTHYTLAGAGGSGGGSLTMLVAPALGSKLTILRTIPITQLVTYLANDNFPHKSHETALDKLTTIIQQLDEKLNRAIVFPETEETAVFTTLSEKGSRVSKMLGFDGNGDMVLLDLDLANLELTISSTINTGDIVDGAVTPIKLSNPFDMNAVGLALTLPMQCLTKENFKDEPYVYDWTRLFLILPDLCVLNNTVFPGMISRDQCMKDAIFDQRLRVGFGGSGRVTDDRPQIEILDASLAVNGIYHYDGAKYIRADNLIKITNVIVAGLPVWKIWTVDEVTPYYYSNDSATTPDQVVEWKFSTGINIGITDTTRSRLDPAIYEICEVNGKVKATHFIGNGAGLTNLPTSASFGITALDFRKGSHGSRFAQNSYSMINSNGELMTFGTGGARMGLGGVLNVLLPRKACFMLGVDAIDGVSDNLNNGVDYIVKVVHRYTSTFALSNTGILYACGNGSNGSLGQGDTLDQVVFKSIRFGASASTNKVIVSFSISDGRDNTCSCLAIDVDGQVWAWGYNGQGQLGDGSTADRTKPVKPAAMVGKVATQVVIVGGLNGSSCALISDGSIMTAGFNGAGELGMGDLVQRNTFTANAVLTTGVVEIYGACHFNTASRTAFYARKSNNDFYGWGYNGQGNLASGDLLNKTTPQLITGNVTQAFLGGDESKSVWVWKSGLSQLRAFGFNTSGQLGVGDALNKNVQTAVVELQAAIIAAGGIIDLVTINWTTCTAVALLTNGEVWCSGYNIQGQQGNNTVVTTNIFKKSLLSHPLNIALGIGLDNVYVLRSDRTVWTCGPNTGYTHGSGEPATTQSQVPLKVKVI
jgi:alpha-tubulin suppressor-like RCC1 family protein